MIPLKYNFRNVRLRWVTNLLTVVSTALVVIVSILTFGLTEGLNNALSVSGDPLDILVMRKGSDAETSSAIESKVAREVVNLPGIAKDAQGKPIAALEYVTILTKPRRNNAGTANLIVRGVQPVSQQLRSGFKITEGRDIKAGVNEIITSRQLADRFDNLHIGEKLDINKVPFTVVGFFEASGSSAESEVWTDIADLTSARKIQGAISIVNLRAESIQSRDSLVNTLTNDDQFKFKALPEAAYFAEQMSASIAFRVLGFIIAGFLTVGAMFAAANTMYAAVASRAREIGTLRAIGFSRGAVMGSFLLESLVLCLLGGVLGCLTVLPLNGVRTGTMNFVTFSELTFAFNFGPVVLFKGVLLATVMGLLGGLFPAARAIRLKIVDALRQA